MDQILHIFRKDVRHLWAHISVVLMLIIAHAVFAVRSWPVDVPRIVRINGIASVLIMLLPLGISFLIALLIFQEALPGERQFWLTRPYRWPKLLASKVLFIAVFINVPLFLSDCYVLGAQSFPVFTALPCLLLRQVFLTALFILPSFAIAAVTAGVAQFMLAWFALLLALIFESLLATSFLGGSIGFDLGSGSIFISALIVTTCAIVIWQYATRRTATARLISLTLVCAFAPVTWGVSYALRRTGVEAERPQSPNRSNVQIAYDPHQHMPSEIGPRTPMLGFVVARIPLTVVGLPPKTLLRGGGRMTIDVDGRAWPHSGTVLGTSIEKVGDVYWQTMDLEMSKLNILKQRTANLHTSFDLEIVTDEVQTRVPVAQRSFFVPGPRFCRTFETATQTQFACREALNPSLETTVRLDSREGPGQVIGSFEPNSVPWGLSPTTDLRAAAFSSGQTGSEFAFIPRGKIAELHRTLDAHNLQLTNYILYRIR